MDILICRLKYPNDPTGTLVSHQHFVGYYENGLLELYSISSILGKEYKVYDRDGLPNENYYILIDDEYTLCNLRVPSFIDCSKSYILHITDDIDITKLQNRNIPKEISINIKNKINEIKDNNGNVQYIISSSDFIIYNERCIIS